MEASNLDAPGGRRRRVRLDDLRARVVARTVWGTPRPRLMQQYRQAYLMAVSFPDTLEKTQALFGTSDDPTQTLVAALRRGVAGGLEAWTAPPGYGVGDVVFFFGTRRALGHIRSIQKSARAAGLSGDEAFMSFLEANARDSRASSGLVIAYGILSGPAEPGPPGPGGAWKSRRYARLDLVVPLTSPIRLASLEPFVPRPHKAMMPLAPDAFARLKDVILESEVWVSSMLRRAHPGSLDTAGLSATTWREVSCRPDQQFRREHDVRSGLADFLLDELKDPGTAVYREVGCRDGAGRSARARPDYVVRIGGSWIPVEVKLALPAAGSLLAQLARYAAVAAFEGTSEAGRRVHLPAATTPAARGVALVIDQAGLSVVRDGEFIAGSAHAPWWPRVAFPARTARSLRRELLALLARGPSA